VQLICIDLVAAYFTHSAMKCVRCCVTSGENKSDKNFTLISHVLFCADLVLL
jgi:hypothetical protein